MVTNPDGSVDAMHEFDNALTSSGSGIITALLMDHADVEEWTISMRQPKPVTFGCVGLVLHLNVAEPFTQVRSFNRPFHPNICFSIPSISEGTTG